MIKNTFPITELKIRILSELFKHRELNLSAINKNTDIASSNILRVLKELNSIIEIKKVGNVKLYSIKKKYVKTLEPLIERFRLEESFGIKNEIFDLLHERLIINELYVFGSFAKNLSTENSDIDLIQIKKILKKKLIK